MLFLVLVAVVAEVEWESVTRGDLFLISLFRIHPYLDHRLCQHGQDHHHVASVFHLDHLLGRQRDRFWALEGAQLNVGSYCR